MTKTPETPQAPTAPLPVTALSADQLAALFKSMGEPAFRATQLREFLFRKGVPDYSRVTNLSKDLRKQLETVAPLYALEYVKHGQGDDANKWLWKARDGALIESVQIRVPGRMTTCLSSQVGCAMGCVFCATGLGGFERHLEPYEIIEQYLQMWGRSGEHSSHVVFMGMGEPLHNYDNVIAAVRMLNTPSPNGCGIGARRITISTVGIVPGMRKLAHEKMQIELAISLHAPDEATRQKLIPAAKRFSIKEIMEAAKEYSYNTGRIMTYEYVLLQGINDHPEQARELAGLLQGTPCKVNLIPFNKVEETPYERPGIPAQEQFKNILEKAGIMTTIRFSKGRTIDAACGQLRRVERNDRQDPAVVPATA